MHLQKEKTKILINFQFLLDASDKIMDCVQSAQGSYF